MFMCSCCSTPWQQLEVVHNRHQRDEHFGDCITVIRTQGQTSALTRVWSAWSPNVSSVNRYCTPPCPLRTTISPPRTLTVPCKAFQPSVGLNNSFLQSMNEIYMSRAKDQGKRSGLKVRKIIIKPDMLTNHHLRIDVVVRNWRLQT